MIPPAIDQLVARGDGEGPGAAPGDDGAVRRADRRRARDAARADRADHGRFDARGLRADAVGAADRHAGRAVAGRALRTAGDSTDDARARSRTPARREGSSDSRVPLFLGLAVLLAVGGGIAAYFLTLNKPAAGQGSGAPVAPVASDPWNAGASADPWATATTEPAIDVGTIETPVPLGFHLNVPSTWTEQRNGTTVGYADTTRGVFVGVGPLVAGTNDPKELAKQWETMAHASLRGMSRVMSGGAMRDAAAFTATVDGVEVGQVIVIYVTPLYRVGVLYQAPVALFGNQQFLAEMTQFFANDVLAP